MANTSASLVDRHPLEPSRGARPDGTWGYGAMAARLTPDQKVGRSNRSGLICLHDMLGTTVMYNGLPTKTFRQPCVGKIL